MLAALLATFWPGESYALLKMTASSGFIATAAVSGCFRSVYGRLVLAGLCFSWCGDLFLLGRGRSYFVAGLVSFLVGHVCYVLAFVRHGSRARAALGWLAALAIPVGVLLTYAWPNVPAALRFPVGSYVLIISIMLALAMGALRRPGGMVIVLGAAAFYLSDVFVARGRFIAPGAINGYFGLPLYFIGQVALAMSVSYGARGLKGRYVDALGCERE